MQIIWVHNRFHLSSALIHTFFGLLLSFYNIKRFGATPAAMTLYMIPIVAGIDGVVILGEDFTSTIIFGMIIIILGVVLLQETNREKWSLKNHI